MEILLARLDFNQKVMVAEMNGLERTDGRRNGSHPSRNKNHPSKNGSHPRQEDGSQYKCLEGRDNVLPSNDSGVSGE
jgi:hypothetical protein